MVKYIRNEEGGVHSVTEEHFESLHEITDSGNAYLPHGWTELTEAEARAAHPQLFGAPDPNLEPHFTDADRKRELERKRDQAELAKLNAELAAGGQS